MGSVDERRLRLLDLSLTLDVDAIRPVHHDLGDGVVAKERLERSIAEDVVGDLTRDLPTLFARQRRAIEGELLGDDPNNPIGEILSRLSGEEFRAELRDAGVMDAGLQLGVGVRCPSAAARPTRIPGCAIDAQRRAVPVGLLGSGLESVVESHGATCDRPVGVAFPALRPGPERATWQARGWISRSQTSAR